MDLVSLLSFGCKQRRLAEVEIRHIACVPRFLLTLTPPLAEQPSFVIRLNAQTIDFDGDDTGMISEFFVAYVDIFPSLRHLRRIVQDSEEKPNILF